MNLVLLSSSLPSLLGSYHLFHVYKGTLFSLHFYCLNLGIFIHHSYSLKVNLAIFIILLIIYPSLYPSLYLSILGSALLFGRCFTLTYSIPLFYSSCLFNCFLYLDYSLVFCFLLLVFSLLFSIISIIIVSIINVVNYISQLAKLFKDFFLIPINFHTTRLLKEESFSLLLLIS
jgi:hypothetical protein